MDHAKIEGATELAHLATCAQPCYGILIQAEEMDVATENNVFVFTWGFSKCGLWTHNISITWELLRNANS